MRGFLRDAAGKVPRELGLDFDGVLRKISSIATIPDGDLTHGVTGLQTSKMVFNEAWNSLQVPDSVFQRSFIIRAADLVAGNGSLPSFDATDITNLFERPLPNSEGATAALPSFAEASVLVDAVFESKDLMLAFLHERHIREMVDVVYTASQRDEAADRFLPILHAVLGLGYLAAQRRTRQGDCDGGHIRATEHLISGQNLLGSAELGTMGGLQTLLCLTVLLISTGRIVSAHSRLETAVSSALQLGLQSDQSSSSPQGRFRIQVFAAVVNLDLWTSSVLGQPPRLSEASLAPLCRHVHRSSVNEADLQISVSLKHSALLILGHSRNHGSGVCGDDNELVETEADLRKWQDEVDMVIRRSEFGRTRSR